MIFFWNLITKFDLSGIISLDWDLPWIFTIFISWITLDLGRGFWSSICWCGSWSIFWSLGDLLFVLRSVDQQFLYPESVHLFFEPDWSVDLFLWHRCREIPWIIIFLFGLKIVDLDVKKHWSPGISVDLSNHTRLKIYAHDPWKLYTTYPFRSSYDPWKIKRDPRRTFLGSARIYRGFLQIKATISVDLKLAA